ncbi:MAG: 30S ribosome-binding factor RbfA [Clostridia bacterium]
MPAFDRTDRISEEVRKALDHIIRDELNDPRIAGTWSIVRADVTRDLRFCKVRVSVFEEDKREALMAALKSASGYIRRALGKAVDLRYTPELLFEEDINIAYADKINRILKEQGNADDQRTNPVD